VDDEAIGEAAVELDEGLLVVVARDIGDGTGEG
jgi:hypothetical protein